MFKILQRAGVLPFENLDCIEKARLSGNPTFAFLSHRLNLSARREILKGNTASVARNSRSKGLRKRTRQLSQKKMIFFC